VFMNGAEGSPASFVFFPGVVKSSEADAVEVKSGLANSELVFNVPPQPTFSVRGTVHAFRKAALPTECKVALVRTDTSSFALTYTQDVAPNGYFDFQRVLPGDYWAFVVVDSDAASNWLTRKAQVDVEVHELLILATPRPRRMVSLTRKCFSKVFAPRNRIGYG
jgi:hypothetical protein